MPNTTIKGTGVITDADYKRVVWVGSTKGGKAISIELENAINLGDIDLSFKEKDDVVAAVTFTAAYTGNETDTKVPWELTVTDGLNALNAGADEIILGAGKFYVYPGGAEYSSSKTYAVGDHCTHSGTTYVCVTAISTAHAWNASEWDEADPAEFLTRGGGGFKVTHENRRINADGDRGAVMGRIVQEGAEATLTLNALTVLKGFTSLYTAVTTVNT